MNTRTQPVDLAARRAQRRKELPNSLSQEQLRRRAVTKMRHNITSLVEENLDELQRNLELVAVVDGPRAYVQSMLSLMEFAVPKLSRAEVSVEDGGKTSKDELTMEELEAMVLEGIAERAKEERTLDGDFSDLTGETTID